MVLAQFFGGLEGFVGVQILQRWVLFCSACFIIEN
jgi:hypothetical protein